MVMKNRRGDVVGRVVANMDALESPKGRQ